MRLLPVTILVAALFAGCGRLLPADGPPPGVLDRLARGVNLSNWYMYREDPANVARFHPDAADYRLIRALGFTHVRLLLDPAYVEDPRRPAVLDPSRVAALLADLKQAVAADLLVVLALQLQPPLKERLRSESRAISALETVWSGLAGGLSQLPPDRLMFEPLNESQFQDAAASRRLMERLALAIRTAAPRHSIAVSGHKYSSVDELVQMAPLEDRNIIYSFHFYEPHNFTHQGATWGWPLWEKFAGWPYPSSPEAVAPLLERAEPDVQEHLRWHGEQRWDRAKLAARVARAADWGRRNGVKIWCGEFGVYRPYLRAEHRAAWLGDLRAALETQDIPWTHWDYAGGFGVVTGTRGERQLDPVAIDALGLRRQ